MNDDTKSAQAEGDALPNFSQPPKGGFFSSVENAVETDVDRVLAAIERWYAGHFHRAAVAGTAPITADEKAALIQHVADAVAPTTAQE